MASETMKIRNNIIVGFIRDNFASIVSDLPLHMNDKEENEKYKRELQLNAIGIREQLLLLYKIPLKYPSKKPERVEIVGRVPVFYRVTGWLFALLSIATVILMYVDIYLNVFGKSISFYITGLLCCLSLYFTNRSAVKDWKKKNVQK